jgi:hypothetical protein
LEIKLNKLAQVIAACWVEAEARLIKRIADQHPNPSEELITDLLEGELRASVARASETHRVEHAFLEDLYSQIPHLDVSEARRFGGLIARVIPHTKPHESRVSAADLGIVILRPQVWLNGWGNETIECSRDHATGLLAQAKLGHYKIRGRGYSWNPLKKSQVDLFAGRHAYYALLLYRLKGMKLNEFQPLCWQLCREHTVEDAKEWLRSDLFPEEQRSSALLKKLFDGEIGTPDRDIIQSIVDPTKGDFHTIEIRIFWPDGSGPPPSFQHHPQHQEASVQRLQQ